MRGVWSVLEENKHKIASETCIFTPLCLSPAHSYSFCTVIISIFEEGTN